MIFKLLNVAVLLAIGWYVYQTRLRPLLIAALTRLHNRRAAAQQEIHAALLAAVDGEAQVLEQRAFCAVAEQRLAQWRAYQAMMLAEQEQEAAKRARQLHAKQLQQIHALQLAHAQAQLSGAIIEEATERLQSTYKLPSQGQAYIRPIITRLEQL